MYWIPLFSHSVSLLYKHDDIRSVFVYEIDISHVGMHLFMHCSILIS